MKILITGGTGLLGKAMIDSLPSGHALVATYAADGVVQDTADVRYEKLDVRDDDACVRLFRQVRPDVTVHAAGIGSPDYAERHRREAYRINVEGTATVLEQCECAGSRLIYISSNGIYDGDSAPYSENDDAHPINYYGRIKLDGENVAKGATVPCAIVRPILMYGWNHPSGRPNIVTYAIARLKKGERVHAYDDVYVTPLSAAHCASAIWKIIDEGHCGTFNIGGRDRMSIFSLVRKAAEVFDLDGELVMPVKQGFFNELVKRPRDTSFDTGKMRSILGMEPLSVEEGLCAMKEAEARVYGAY